MIGMIFSELTFHPGGGLIPFKPASYDVQFGKYFSNNVKLEEVSALN